MIHVTNKQQDEWLNNIVIIIGTLHTDHLHVAGYRSELVGP